MNTKLLSHPVSGTAEVKKRELFAPELRAECRRISSMLAAGFSPFDIRAELGLTNRAWKQRMAVIRAKTSDHAQTWVMYRAKTEARYAQLEGIRQKALIDDKLDIARKAVLDMKSLDREIIEVGQMLGVYQKSPDVVEVRAPSLGLFHSNRISEGDAN